MMRRSLSLYPSDSKGEPRPISGVTTVAVRPRALGRSPGVGLPSLSHAHRGSLTQRSSVPHGFCRYIL
jgi:hypothetical protein